MMAFGSPLQPDDAWRLQALAEARAELVALSPAMLADSVRPLPPVTFAGPCTYGWWAVRPDQAISFYTHLADAIEATEGDR